MQEELTRLADKLDVGNEGQRGDRNDIWPELLHGCWCYLLTWGKLREKIEGIKRNREFSFGSDRLGTFA